ncbi:MAG: type II/IV secretion system protein [Candidatus Omnitrophica bacterium]|nr:type II/IV secretion system protein [Candidatus Omnitrophota bacterium]
MSPEVVAEDNVFLRIVNERRLLEPTEVERLLKSESNNGNSFDATLLEEGIYTRDEILKTLENYFFYPSLDLNKIKPDPSALLLVPDRMARRYQAFPIKKENGVLEIAMASPDNNRAIEDLKLASECRLNIHVAPQSDVVESIESWYGTLAKELKPKTKDQQKKSLFGDVFISGAKPLLPELMEEEHGATELSAKIFQKAADLNVTDIHIEPGRGRLTVRFRIDGILQVACVFPESMTPTLISRIKIVSGMDIAERRVPQDGRTSIEHPIKGLVDCRVSSLPSTWGEKIVVRLLTKDDSLLNLNNLHMPAELHEKWRQVVGLPLGMILVTGPTGSGKTTTLYASIAELDRGSTNIITLEDPVEYEMDGITQVQIHSKAGLTFQSGLRSILRQDPDTVLVGEIRDHETAEIACRAALTGHKMFSTLHTNDAASAVTRLVDMGVEPYLLTAALKAVLAQRLIRVLCPHCKQTKPTTKTDQARLEAPDLKEFQVANGCRKCSGTGFHGRQAVYELLLVEESVHDLIINRGSSREITRIGMKEGMTCLRESAKKLVLEGVHSLSEVERVGLLKRE